MQGSVILHPYVDILIGTSYQAYYRLLIFVCHVTPCITARSPWWILISPKAERADSCTLCILPPFCILHIDISLPKGRIAKSYIGTRVTSASCHSVNQASS